MFEVPSVTGPSSKLAKHRLTTLVGANGENPVAHKPKAFTCSSVS
jgi:hypothetical protein